MRVKISTSQLKSNSNRMAIYIHWPFCLSLCPYCDFNSHIASSVNHGEWSDSYLKELEYYLPIIQGKEISSIFFGGGTPSLMNPKTVNNIINFLSKHALVESNIEISLEANPTSVEVKKFQEFQEAGINRLSLGIQSLIDPDLKLLGRKHSALEAKKALEIARKYFQNYSFDLIYSRPNQTVKLWEKELKEALSLAGPHLSLYQLTIEKGTPFYKMHKDGNIILPDEETSANLYDLTNEILLEHNLHRYEISNYAKPTYECKHNLTYWNYNEYLGIGPGAHSRIGGHEMMTFHNPSKWQTEISTNDHAIQKNTKLSKEEVITEIIMMMLRTSKGLNTEDFLQKTGVQFQDSCNSAYLNLLLEKNIMIYSSESRSYSLSSSGMNIHSYIVPRLIRDTLNF